MFTHVHLCSLHGILYEKRIGDKHEEQLMRRRIRVKLRHNNDIAVFMDFVGAHFAKDEWGLVEYCGVPQYEYEGNLGEIPGWGTARYNYAKAEVQAYLLGALP